MGGNMGWGKKATQGWEGRNRAGGSGQGKGQGEQRDTEKVASTFGDCHFYSLPRVGSAGNAGGA